MMTDANHRDNGKRQLIIVLSVLALFEFVGIVVVVASRLR